MVIAFDFDKTASEARIHTVIKKLVRERNEVWVITMRSENGFNKKVLKPVLDKLYLSFSNVVFCGDKPKLEMLQMINADIYIDNISDEFGTILNHTNTIPLLWCSR